MAYHQVSQYANSTFQQKRIDAIGFISEFIKKAKQEASREYSIGLSGESRLNQGWIGVDLDGTLARSDTIMSVDTIGNPVPKMLDFVNDLLDKGNRVKIFTARASDPDQIELIEEWLIANGLPKLEITNRKDYGMLKLYDDRAVQVIPNTGEIVG